MVKQKEVVEPEKIWIHKTFKCNSSSCGAALIIEEERLKVTGSECRHCGGTTTEVIQP